MRKLASFLVTFFSPAGLFPTASLAKHRKPRPRVFSFSNIAAAGIREEGHFLLCFFL